MPVSGAAEIAPHLGIADIVTDLVSTGSTLVMNGLRPIGDVLASQAVLVANPSLGGKPYATPTLWAAIQYLMPGEDAPEHRRSLDRAG